MLTEDNNGLCISGGDVDMILLFAGPFLHESSPFDNRRIIKISHNLGKSINIY